LRAAATSRGVARLAFSKGNCLAFFIKRSLRPAREPSTMRILPLPTPLRSARLSLVLVRDIWKTRSHWYAADLDGYERSIEKILTVTPHGPHTHASLIPNRNVYEADNTAMFASEGHSKLAEIFIQHNQARKPHGGLYRGSLRRRDPRASRPPMPHRVQRR
jgi:hypothetical protein